ncbi:MAG: DUF262 domain-containing protein [Thiobacillus sp.]|nr:DUF262 domain-containing protein [Thiobacillus sp.]
MSEYKQALEPLERRPEARGIRVEDLLSEVRTGRVRIPSFQRALKWDRSDASKLFDSLYRGFPIGTLLFWETDAGAEEMRFGTVNVSAGSRSDALWVIDGQQRIVSLARVLLALEPDKDDFALYFDLDEREFVVPPSPVLRESDPSRWLPMTVVLNSESLMQWAFQWAAEDRERREQAFLLGKRIREYEVPIYLVRSASESTLREIFGRINSSGKRLDVNEVFDALHGGRATSRPATLREIVSELEKLGFGRVDDKILYRLLRVLQGEDVSERTDGGPLRLSEEQVESAYRDTAETAAAVIRFVKQDVGISHYELLPYKQPMVTLGKFFHLHPEPEPRTRELLVRWLWRGALNGAHRGDTVSTRKVLDRIGSASGERSVERMLEMVQAQPEAWPDPAEPFNFRFASGKLQALALMSLRPRDLETGEVLDLAAELGRPGVDLPFPYVLASLAGAPAALAQSTANRLAHPVRHGLRRTLLAVTNPAILASHGIDEAAMAALSEGDAVRFLRVRAALLDNHFHHYFAQHARWGETDRPALAALLIPDEEG